MSIINIGIDYKVKKLQYEGKDIKLNIWDTAGQEKFRSITLNFYKGVDGIILVFDITDENSFTNIPHWIRQIKLYASENCAMVLLGNKCDMMDRKISKDRIDECCTEYGLKYFESSAKMNINIEQAFITIVKDISLKETVKETVENPSILPSGGEESEIKEKKGKNGIILGKKKKKDDDEISDISQCQC